MAGPTRSEALAGAFPGRRASSPVWQAGRRAATPRRGPPPPTGELELPPAGDRTLGSGPHGPGRGHAGVVPSKKAVRRDSLVFVGVIWLFDQPWSDGLLSSLGQCDPLFARTASWRWRTSRFGSNSRCGRREPRPRLTPLDRMFWVVLSSFWKSWRSSLQVVRPETVVRWHRQGFRHYWACKSRRRCGRPGIEIELRDLIRRMSRAILSGARRGSMGSCRSWG